MRHLCFSPRRVLVAGAALVVLVGAGAVGLHASTPPSENVTVPSQAGQTVIASWSGTIPVAATPTSDCNDQVLFDEHLLNVTLPRKGYDRIDATFEFSITWTPASPSTATSDEILTVNGPDAADEGDNETNEINSSDGSGTTETVIAHNLPGGTYHALACGFANTAQQQYTGTLKITTEAKNAEKNLPSANARGLAFSAAVPADPQRDESEPLMEIDRAGNIYTCGPTGFSQAVDYAQVSTDGGDQFHLLGTPPRGQQGVAGGGDCAMATGVTKNSLGNYQYAYAGLGALSGFTTATSPNNGHSIASAGADVNGGITSQGVLADRQWATFTDDHTALLSWNQQVPRNTVVVKSTDGGLTYSPVASVAAPNPEFPGPMGYIVSSGTVYMPWTKGEEVNFAISRDGGTTWTNCVVAKGDTVKGGTAGFAVADHDGAGNVYVVWADSSRYHTWMSVLTADKVAGCNEPVERVRNDRTNGSQPIVNPGWTTPVQVDRDDVRTTVFPWVAAGGSAGRVAVTFYGTPSDGDPNSGEFNAAWDVYVNQSLNALDASRTFSQVKATTHPFHFDSICLNGLGCDLATPPGDRSLADFFAIDYSPTTQRLSVVFNRGNKKPDEATGHVATPVVVTQIGGPTLGGGTLTPLASDAVVRTSSSDPGGDAQSSYSITAPAVVPPAPPTTNEPAADFTNVSVGAAKGGGFTVTMNVKDLSTASLLNTLSRTGSQSLLWLYRFTNGYQDVTAGARWNPVQGFTFGYNDFVPGAGPCLSVAPGANDKCIVFPGDQPIEGSVDQASGTITVTVPLYLLRALTGSTSGASRPTEVQATAGSRLYDGQAFSMGNTLSPFQDVQSWLYPFDNTPSMDFLVPAALATTSCATGGGAINGGKFSFDVQQPGGGDLQYRDAGSNVDFVSTAMTSVTCIGNKAHITGVGKNRSDDATFTADAVDNGEPGTADTFAITLSSPSGYSRSGTLTRGNIQVRR